MAYLSTYGDRPPATFAHLLASVNEATIESSAVREVTETDYPHVAELLNTAFSNGRVIDCTVEKEMKAFKVEVLSKTENSPQVTIPKAAKTIEAFKAQIISESKGTLLLVNKVFHTKTYESDYGYKDTRTLAIFRKAIPLDTEKAYEISVMYAFKPTRIGVDSSGSVWAYDPIDSTDVTISTQTFLFEKTMIDLVTTNLSRGNQAEIERLCRGFVRESEQRQSIKQLRCEAHREVILEKEGDVRWRIQRLLDKTKENHFLKED